MNIKQITKFLIVALFSGITIFGCGKNESSENRILSFAFKEIETLNVEITDNEVLIDVATDANTNALTPEIEISAKAAINPKSGVAKSFTSDVNYTVTAEDGTPREYVVKITKQGSSENTLYTFTFPDLYREGKVSGNTISIDVSYGTDLTNIKASASLSAKAVTEPLLSEITDFSSPVSFNVVAENGEKNEYTVTVNVLPQETGIRGVYIPAPAHTSAMTSYNNIVNTVNLLDELNINTAFICSWAQTKTTFPSQVLVDNSAYTNTDECNWFTNYNYSGLTNDPLADFITEAHKKGIKVILWFEYGFMAKWGTEPTPANDKILEKNPHWVGLNNSGNPSNYNGTDYYYNAYHPEVQDFVLALMKEAVNNYDLDGVTGDDRLPAMPVNSGYDDYTVQRYKNEHGGQAPPFTSYLAPDWLQWRLDILNAFAKRMYDEIKDIDNTLLVGAAPNPYPWVRENLMQEWPKWIEDGAVDFVAPQCYRNSISDYQSLVYDQQKNVTDITTKNIFMPSVLLKTGSSQIIDDYTLSEILLYNRKRNTAGEIYFFNEALKGSGVKKVLKAFYAGEAIYPNFQAE